MKLSAFLLLTLLFACIQHATAADAHPDASDVAVLHRRRFRDRAWVKKGVERIKKTVIGAVNLATNLANRTVHGIGRSISEGGKKYFKQITNNVNKTTTFFKTPKDERRAKMKEDWKKCMNNKVGCLGGAVINTVKQGLGLNSLPGKILTNMASRLTEVIPDNRFSRFVSAAGAGVAETIKMAGHAIINPINTGRAVVQLAKEHVKKLKSTTFEERKAERREELRTQCEGVDSEGYEIDKATCRGQRFGNNIIPIGRGGVLQKVTDKAEEIATDGGHKDNMAQTFSKGFVAAGTDMVAAVPMMAANPTMIVGAMAGMIDADDSKAGAELVADGIKEAWALCKKDPATCAGRTAFNVAEVMVTGGSAAAKKLGQNIGMKAAKSLRKIKGIPDPKVPGGVDPDDFVVAETRVIESAKKLDKEKLDKEVKDIPDPKKRKDE
jgi:hypothetical protein